MMKTGTLPLPGLDKNVPVIWLKKREARLLRLIVQAKTPKQIASLLFLSDNTVRGHIADLGRAIGEASLPPRSPLSLPELLVWALQTNGSLKQGPVTMQEHPPNCSCASAYCKATFQSLDMQ